MGLKEDLFGYKQGVRVSKQAAASSDYSANEHSLTIGKDSTLEKIDFRIYPGAELALRIKAFIKRAQTESLEPIIKFLGKDYIDGDDDKFDYDVSIPLFKNDQIVIQAKNSDGTYAYDYAVGYSIDYLGGVERLIYGRRR